MSVVGFESFLLLGSRKRSTVQDHVKLFKVLAKELSEITKPNMEQFIVTRLKGGMKKSALNKYIGTAKLYGRYVGDTELEKLHYFKLPKTKKEVFSLEELRAFLTVECPNPKYQDVWDKWSLFWRCLTLTGARCSEIATLQRKHIDLGRKLFFFEDTKTNDFRLAPIVDELMEHISELVHGLAQDDYVFVTTKGKVFSDRSWSHNFRNRVELLGINREGLTPYSLRARA